MYESFFGFQERPFPSSPQTKFYFPARTIDDAYRATSRLIEREEGIGLVVGAVGTGKTLLGHLLVERFCEKLSTVFLASGNLASPKALLQHILFELKLPYRQMEEGELRLTLLDYLEPNRGGARDLLVVIDEAHGLSLRVLEELRLLSCLVRGGRTRVRLVLVGQPRIEERLAVPRLEALNQRIATRCYLSALSAQETSDFIRHQLTCVGAKLEDVFDPDAVSLIHRSTEGIPRLVNQLCDHALVLGCADGCRPVDAALVEEAWCELHRLPLRKESRLNGSDTSLSSVIEFGTLGDSWEDSGETTDATIESSPQKVAAEIESQPRSLSPVVPPLPGTLTESQPSPIETHPDEAAVGGVANVRDPSGRDIAQDEALPLDNVHAPMSVSDPFDGTFAEEELIVDRFADDPLPAAKLPRGSTVEQWAAEVPPVPSEPSAGQEVSDTGCTDTPERALSSVPTNPWPVAGSSSRLEWEEQLLFESLAALWNQPVWAGRGVETLDIGAQPLRDVWRVRATKPLET